MKILYSVTKRFFAEIWSDAMLVALFFVPIIMGFIFRFGVPALESYLCAGIDCTDILASYYAVFDLLLSIMTPLMFTTAGAMVILDEADFGLAKAIAVTPVGRRGYLFSRICVPALMATVYCIIITLLFRISDMSILTIILLAIGSGFLSVTVALTISSMAKNKVEGLAYSKLSGLFVVGLPISLLVPAPFKYIAAFLPTFWMTEITQGGSLWLIVPTIMTAVFLSVLFSRHFLRKILG